MQPLYLNQQYFTYLIYTKPKTILIVNTRSQIFVVTDSHSNNATLHYSQAERDTATASDDLQNVSYDRDSSSAPHVIPYRVHVSCLSAGDSAAAAMGPPRKQPPSLLALCHTSVALHLASTCRMLQVSN